MTLFPTCGAPPSRMDERRAGSLPASPLVAISSINSNVGSAAISRWLALPTVGRTHMAEPVLQFSRAHAVCQDHARDLSDVSQASCCVPPLHAVNKSTERKTWRTQSKGIPHP